MLTGEEEEVTHFLLCAGPFNTT